MNTSEIINYLEENDLTEIEEIKQNSDCLIIKFCYDFDKEELSAAKSYSNEESDFEQESDGWYNEYYIPFLKDIAIDNVSSIVEEIMDEFEIEGNYKEIGIDGGNNEYFKFLAAFSSELSDAELEEILNDYH